MTRFVIILFCILLLPILAGCGGGGSTAGATRSLGDVAGKSHAETAVTTNSTGDQTETETPPPPPGNSEFETPPPPPGY